MPSPRIRRFRRGRRCSHRGFPCAARELTLGDLEFVFDDRSRVSGEAIELRFKGKQTTPGRSAQDVVLLGGQQMAQPRLGMDCRKRARELISLSHTEYSLRFTKCKLI